MPRASLCVLILSLLVLPFVLPPHSFAQDAATGAIHGTVVDLHDLRIPGADHRGGQHRHRRSLLRHVRRRRPLRHRSASARRLLRPRRREGYVSANHTRSCTSMSAPPPNSNSVSASPELTKTSPSPALPHWSTLNHAPSPLSSTNAPSPISPSTAAASPISCCSRPA